MRSGHLERGFGQTVIAADVGSVFGRTGRRLGMKQMSRFRKDRGFERWLEMELVNSVDEEKKHLVSYNQWDSSLAILRLLGTWGAGVWWAATVRRKLCNLPQIVTD